MPQVYDSLPWSLSEIDSVDWLGLECQPRRCRNVQIALLFGASLRLDPAVRSAAPSSVAYSRQTPKHLGLGRDSDHHEPDQVTVSRVALRVRRRAGKLELTRMAWPELMELLTA